jgi:hypothetical protein
MAGYFRQARESRRLRLGHSGEDGSGNVSGQLESPPFCRAISQLALRQGKDHWRRYPELGDQGLMIPENGHTVAVLLRCS